MRAKQLKDTKNGEFKIIPGEDELMREEEKDFEKGNRYLQYLASISVSLLSMTCGTIYTWTSPALPHLRSNNSEIILTETELVWIATLPDIGAFFGNVAMIFALQHFGRKYWILFLGAPHIFMWLVIIFATNFYMLSIPRFLSGIIGDLGFMLLPLYIGEIADKDIRGILLLLIKIFSNIGHMYVKTIGAFFSFRVLNIMMLFVPCLFFATFLFMPESPYYLLLMNRNEKALKTLMKLKGVRNEGKMVHFELERMQNAVDDSRQNKKWMFGELFFIKGNRRSLIIVLVAWLTKFLCGATAINSFTQEILEATEIEVSPKICAMLLAVIEVLLTLSATSIIERAGRRWTFLLSGIFCSFGLLIVGVFFYLKLGTELDVKPFSWLPLFGLFVYQISFSLGIAYIPIIMIGEMFSIDVKMPAMFCLNVSMSLLLIGIKVAFQKLNSVIGIYTTFWIFAVCCTVGSIVFFIITPETKGKTLEEIQDRLHRKKSYVSEEIIIPSEKY
ncbi:facilitated trehalose transporter Tret1-like [Leptopilina heterotoma]|uniref:facilitated trehalose transporter Tret1-like n=1 Tax=Leptopilina heterotoma TaxID=63436 RepID=UPI001CA9286F|nr:facilitated trehalose transporter Tret1-like [Leptopilina heterotoma]